MLPIRFFFETKARLTAHHHEIHRFRSLEAQFLHGINPQLPRRTCFFLYIIIMSLTSQGLVHWWTWKCDLNECLKCDYLKIVARFETHTTILKSPEFLSSFLIYHDIVNCQHEAIMLDLSWPRHCCHSMSRWYWEVTCSNPARRGCCQQICPYGIQDLWHVDIRPWSKRVLGYTPNQNQATS